MAISKAEAVKAARESVASEVDAWEKKIDAWLYSQQSHAYLAYTCDNIPQIVREMLIERYRAVGWDCRYENDQRDGAFLRFS